MMMIKQTKKRDRSKRHSWTNTTNLTIYQETPSISFKVSNGGEEKLKKEKRKKRKC